MTVGLEQTEYTVTEANTTLSICATIRGDIDDSVIIQLVTVSFLGTAVGECGNPECSSPLTHVDIVGTRLCA